MTSDGGAPISIFLCMSNHRFVTVGRVYYGQLPPLSGVHVAMRERALVHEFHCPCGAATKKRAHPTKDRLNAAEAAFLIGGWDAALGTLRTSWPVTAPKRRAISTLPGRVHLALPEWPGDDMSRWGFYSLRGGW